MTTAFLMVIISTMNNLLVTALNNNERFIKQYNLVPNIAYLTLLYYQYSYLQSISEKERDKEDIVCSYFESNYQSPHVVIMSHYKDKKRYTLRRVRLKEDVYKDLEQTYKDAKGTPINDELLKHFQTLHYRYNKGDTYEQILCKSH